LLLDHVCCCLLQPVVQLHNLPSTQGIEQQSGLALGHRGSTCRSRVLPAVSEDKARLPPSCLQRCTAS
jgi:hypothetical protein